MFNAYVIVYFTVVKSKLRICINVYAATACNTPIIIYLSVVNIYV